MRFMMLVIPEGYGEAEPGTAPDAEQVEAMMESYEALGLAPREPEVHGLVSLMEIQASRLGARVGPDGAAVLLPDQDRARWDQLHIRRGLRSAPKPESP